QVEDHVKDERRERLMLAQQELLEKKLSEKVGTIEKVIFEGEHPESELLYQCRAQWQGVDADGVTIINDTNDEPLSDDMKGQFISVEITEVAGYDLLAKIV